jgi:hypothetical protein
LERSFIADSLYFMDAFDPERWYAASANIAWRSAPAASPVSESATGTRTYQYFPSELGKEFKKK